MITKKMYTKVVSFKPIIDIEISNDISNPKGGDWFYDKGDIITFGLIYKKTAWIIQRQKNDKKEDFILAIKKLLKDYNTIYNNQDYHAFNWRMEKDGIFGFCGLNLEFKEIKPWKGKGWNKDKFFEELKTIIKPQDDINDPLNGDSSLIQDRYNKEMYEDIIKHNLSCLIKETYITRFRPLLIKKNKENIDSNGWWKNGNCND